MFLPPATLLLIMSALAFLLTLGGLMRHPYREYRLAGLAGLLMSVSATVARAVAIQRLVWTPPSSPVTVRVSTFFLSTLTLVLIALAWRDLRRRSRRPSLVGALGLVPGVLLVLCMLWLDAGLEGNIDELMTVLPYQALLAVLAFAGPALLFELLRQAGVWADVPAEPPVGGG